MHVILIKFRSTQTNTKQIKTETAHWTSGASAKNPKTTIYNIKRWVTAVLNATRDGNKQIQTYLRRTLKNHPLTELIDSPTTPPPPLCGGRIVIVAIGNRNQSGPNGECPALYAPVYIRAFRSRDPRWFRLSITEIVAPPKCFVLWRNGREMDISVS